MFKLKEFNCSKLLSILIHFIESSSPQHNKYSLSIEFFNTQAPSLFEFSKVIENVGLSGY